MTEQTNAQKTETETDRHSDRQTDQQTDRQTDRQTRQMDRPADRHFILKTHSSPEANLSKQYLVCLVVRLVGLTLHYHLGRWFYVILIDGLSR